MTRMHNIEDVYFFKNYGLVCEEIDGGRCEEFLFSCEYGTVYSLFILKEIEYTVDGERYYDIQTPYGYGGPIVLECADCDRLVVEYEKAFSAYCRENKIVSEFVRFHPILENDKPFFKMYNATFNRYTIMLDLTDEGIFYNQISSKCRNMIRKSEKCGVQVILDEELNTIDTFQELYYLTMKKNEANDIYFFSKNYFLKLKKELKEHSFILNAVLNDKIIASALFFYYGENMHYHLSATIPDFYSYASGNLLLWSAIQEGQKRGIKRLHLGGGTSSDENDHLFKYKRSFGAKEQNLRRFYIGKKIYDSEIYNSLVEMHYKHIGEPKDKNFFPQYRV